MGFGNHYDDLGSLFIIQEQYPVTHPQNLISWFVGHDCKRKRAILKVGWQEDVIHFNYLETEQKLDLS